MSITRLGAAFLLITTTATPRGQEQLEGTFHARIDRNPYVSLSITTSRGGFSNWGRSFERSELRDLSVSNGRVSFRLVRDAGTFDLDGRGTEQKVNGSFVFRANDGYRSQLAALGFSGLTLENLFVFAMGNLSVGDVRFMEQATTDDLTTTQLVKLMHHGVDVEFVKGLEAAGFSRLSSDELLRTRDHGVTPEYITVMRKHGHRLTLEQYIRGKDHGVSEKYVTEMKELGFNLSFEQLVKSRDHGVDSDFIREFAALGIDDLTMEQYTRLRDHGVTGDFALSFKDLGYTLQPDELVKLRDHGVSAGFVRHVNREKGQRLGVSELVRLKNHGDDDD